MLPEAFALLTNGQIILRQRLTITDPTIYRSRSSPPIYFYKDQCGFVFCHYKSRKDCLTDPIQIQIIHLVIVFEVVTSIMMALVLVLYTNHNYYFFRNMLMLCSIFQSEFVVSSWAQLVTINNRRSKKVPHKHHKKLERFFVISCCAKVVRVAWVGRLYFTYVCTCVTQIHKSKYKQLCICISERFWELLPSVVWEKSSEWHERSVLWLFACLPVALLCYYATVWFVL